MVCGVIIERYLGTCTVVSALQRSPGVLFEHDNGKNYRAKNQLTPFFRARGYPYAREMDQWLILSFDHKIIRFVLHPVRCLAIVRLQCNVSLLIDL